MRESWFAAALPTQTGCRCALVTLANHFIYIIKVTNDKVIGEISSFVGHNRCNISRLCFLTSKEKAMCKCGPRYIMKGYRAA